jgi:hypothetical protein
MAATTVRDAPAAAPDETEPPAPPWWSRVEVWIGLLIVVACCVFIFVQLDPRLLLRNTTASGGDTGAHVWWPAYLRDHLLPWRLAGWSPDFYAGFPAGQFYFPVPALLIVGLNLVIPYNVAFKLVTALGPMLLPVGAYVFARGIRAPNPAPAALAVAATGFLFFNGDPGTSQADKGIAFNQHIMGGNLASNLAGEFSFTLALAFMLLFLGTLAWALRTRRAPWLPAVLLAATMMSHLVVGVFALVGAAVVFLGARPRSTVPRPGAQRAVAGGVLAAVGVVLALISGSVLIGGLLVVVGLGIVAFEVWPAVTLGRAAAIGGVGALLTAVWSVPLVATLQYTTDMRYGAIGVSKDSATYGRYLFPSYLFGGHGPYPWQWGLRGALPWQWGATALIAIAIIGGIVARRRSTILLVTLTAASGLLFYVWASIQFAPAWNLRLLPFWYLCVFLLMGLGVAELVRGAVWLARRLAERRHLALGRYGPRGTVQLVAVATAGILTLLLALGALVNIDRSKDFLPYWIKWNESGYQDLQGQGPGLKKAYPEYRRLIDTIDRLHPGRVMWEGGAALNIYGTPLALMLLPYWTNGRFPSMEGLYYESSATTPYVFMTAATVDATGNASNPVRGVTYRTFTDFSLGVRYLQLLGVQYYVAHSASASHAADTDPRLTLVATSATAPGGIAPDTWRIYRVANAPAVEPVAYQPIVVASLSASEQALCRRQVLAAGVEPNQYKRHDWQDCIGVPWFNDPSALDRPLVADGPTSWQRAQPSVALTATKQTLPAVTVTRIHQTDSSVSFHVSRTGVPILVKTSYFPNWTVQGARGPYRSTPNFMVVVPTSKDVRLTYGTTTAEWGGRVLTLLGVAGLGVLVWWGRRNRRARRVG